MTTTTLPDLAATLAYGAAVGVSLKPGEILALTGDLGAGKTHFTKGVALGLGAAENEVTSPTFTLINEYAGGRLPLYHFDFYRLDSPEEALRLDLDDYLEGRGVCVIEWADKFPELLPPRTRWFHFSIGADEARLVREEP